MSLPPFSSAAPFCWRTTLCIAALMQAAPSVADGVALRPVEFPYVNALENEIELRTTRLEGNHGEGRQLNTLAYGRAIGSRWFAELAATTSDDDNDSLAAYEIEAKYQLSEQGEFSADWGLLLEYEREKSADRHEISALLLSSRDIARWTASCNLAVISEWGGPIDSEQEFAAHLQARYRWHRHFEPAIEFHWGEASELLGLTQRGKYVLSGGKSVAWQLGVYTGITAESPDTVFDAVFEFEF